MKHVLHKNQFVIPNCDTNHASLKFDQEDKHKRDIVTFDGLFKIIRCYICAYQLMPRIGAHYAPPSNFTRQLVIWCLAWFGT
jgi:hypothetical protein